MNEQSIHNSIGQEIGRNLQARMKRNGGNINLLDVIEEAKFSLAVNVMISQRQIKAQTGGQMQMVPPLTIEYMFEGMKKALKNFFPNNFKDEHFEKVKEGYYIIMADDNAKDLINNHYNDLYQDYSSNIL
ncbi:MAG: hypothetical protein Q8N66_13115 [Bacteroidota bacterium]|nr:hypothetical protein [Bacteroidota bacterium]